MNNSIIHYDTINYCHPYINELDDKDKKEVINLINKYICSLYNKIIKKNIN